MNKEQPICEVSDTVSAESNVLLSADSTIGSLDKFKDVKSLQEAYVNLQSEFTRKCQKLSELEKDNLKKQELEVNNQNSENFKPFYEKPEWNDYVKNFLQNNSIAQNYASEIMDVLVSDKVVASLPNSLDVALNMVLGAKYKPEHELVSDPEFLQKYVLNNPEIKNKIISDYLSELKQKQSPQLISSSKTSGLGITPNKKPNSLFEAKEMAVKLFNK